MRSSEIEGDEHSNLSVAPPNSDQPYLSTVEGINENILQSI